MLKSSCQTKRAWANALFSVQSLAHFKITITTCMFDILLGLQQASFPSVSCDAHTPNSLPETSHDEYNK